MSKKRNTINTTYVASGKNQTSTPYLPNKHFQQGYNSNKGCGINQLNSKSFYKAYICLAWHAGFDTYKTKLSKLYLKKWMGAAVNKKNINQR